MPFKDIDTVTPADIEMAVEVEKEKQKDFFQVLAWIVYNGASLTGVAVNDPRKFPKLEEAFPSLFEKKEQKDWWIMKQRIDKYAQANNKRSD